MIEELRQNAPVEEFDYPFLMSHLQGYKNPRDKVTRLLRSQAIIRVKKGLYIFGPKYRRRPYCLEGLANLIYGPSYLSLEYALAYYQMIPERVERITSMTCKKDKVFHTVVGLFSYRYLHPSKYSIGITQVQIDPEHFVFIATREKALADLLAQQSPFENREEVWRYLTQSLRIPEEELVKIKANDLRTIALVYRHQNIDLLVQHWDRL